MASTVKGLAFTFFQSNNSGLIIYTDCKDMDFRGSIIKKSFNNFRCIRDTATREFLSNLYSVSPRQISRNGSGITGYGKMVKITISGSNNRLYLNKEDGRGRWLIKRNGVTQPLITKIWRKAVETINPTIVLDVGLNYGEILFSTICKKKTQIIGIEANKGLAPYIENSGIPFLCIVVFLRLTLKVMKSMS